MISEPAKDEARERIASSNQNAVSSHHHFTSLLLCLQERDVKHTLAMGFGKAKQEEADVASFFGLVLLTVLVAFVLPNLSFLFSSREGEEDDEQVAGEDHMSAVKARMAERDIYRHNARSKTTSIFDGWTGTSGAGGRPLDDDEITVHTLLQDAGDDDEDDATTKDDDGTVASNATNATDASQWRCACETGFVPSGLLKSFGGAESVIRLSTGQCYHKQK